VDRGARDLGSSSMCLAEERPPSRSVCRDAANLPSPRKANREQSKVNTDMDCLCV
jgi:hypothetical protein